MVTFMAKEGDADILIDQAEVEKVFVKARQNLAKVHIQTSGENGTIVEDPIKRGKGDVEKIETEDVELVPNQNTRIGKQLAKGEKERLLSLLLMNKDLFAYSPKDMPGINPNIIQHSHKVQSKG